MVQIGEPLPRASEALISEEKLRGYVLNPEHSDGQHKARVFYSTLGLGQEDWRDLLEQVLAGVQDQPVTDVRPAFNGTRCTVVVPVRGPNGAERPVVTGWRVPDDGSAPHLTTAYIRP
jgi:hypothetical protein